MTEPTRMQQYEAFLRHNDDKLKSAVLNITNDEHFTTVLMSMKHSIHTLLNIHAEYQKNIMQAFSDINNINVPYSTVSKAKIRGIDEMKLKQQRKNYVAGKARRKKVD